MLNNNEAPQAKKRKSWPWIAGSVALLVIAGLVFYYRQYKVKSELNGPVTSVSEVIEAKAPEAEQGKMAVFGDVVVKLANNDDIVFWIGDNSSVVNGTVGEGLLVFTNFDLQSKTHRNNQGRLTDGQHIKITGVLKLAPTVQDMKNMWQLSESAAARVKQQKIYLDANSLELLH